MAMSRKYRDGVRAEFEFWRCLANVILRLQKLRKARAYGVKTDESNARESELRCIPERMNAPKEKNKGGIQTKKTDAMET